MVERMLKHALPPLVEAGNRAALDSLAAKAGTDSPTLLHNYGHTIIAKCLYEGEALPRKWLLRLIPSGGITGSTRPAFERVCPAPESRHQALLAAHDRPWQRMHSVMVQTLCAFAMQGQMTLTPL